MQKCIKSRKPPQVCPVLNFDGRANLLELLVISHKILHVCISSCKPRACQKTRWWANARPPGHAKFANAPPPGLTRRTNAPQLPGGGGWAQLEWTDALPRPR